jgi:hypothetical protein
VINNFALRFNYVTGRIEGIAVALRLPLIFLQNWPVGCKVSGNLSEGVFLFLGSDLCFAMSNILNYSHINKQFNRHNQIVSFDLVVVRVVIEKFYLTKKTCNLL